MHPALVFGIVIGGALVLWGGYEAVNTIYEWHQDRQEQKSYEEYVKAHAEKGRLVPVTLFENHDEDDEEDDEPLGVWQKRDSMHSQLRHRNNHSSSEEVKTLKV
ncbi:uncharacterized protein EV154DRAFT_533943 [Mucor mucedo]|uniref:uncharacterized protein n=1 Tax=Mucor mucedo TaxID=29922 RepID=UPI0022200FED|nr:uncharacterized protein EV154DRAFT_533943 [Mucor mucedo]KAI7864717.1 hypothetical protein EV154DRAFT_533943 [Mucor mucedo]